MTDTVYEYAHTYSQFLWGIPGWLTYTPGIVAVGYLLYNRKASVTRLSAVTEPLLGKRAHGALGAVMDVVVTAAKRLRHFYLAGSWRADAYRRSDGFDRLAGEHPADHWCALGLDASLCTDDVSGP